MAKPLIFTISAAWDDAEVWSGHCDDIPAAADAQRSTSSWRRYRRWRAISCPTIILMSIRDRFICKQILGCAKPQRLYARVHIMPYVQSSMMTFVKYDDDACELDIIFTSGKTYRYLEVPSEIYDGLLDAESKGEFFNDNIKDTFIHSEVMRRRSR